MSHHMKSLIKINSKTAARKLELLTQRGAKFLIQAAPSLRFSRVHTNM